MNKKILYSCLAILLCLLLVAALVPIIFFLIVNPIVVALQVPIGYQKYFILGGGIIWLIFASKILSFAEQISD